MERFSPAICDDLGKYFSVPFVEAEDYCFATGSRSPFAFDSSGPEVASSTSTSTSPQKVSAATIQPARPRRIFKKSALTVSCVNPVNSVGLHWGPIGRENGLREGERNKLFMRTLFVLVGVLCFVPSLGAQTILKNYQFNDGNWFNGKSFRKDTFYSVNGVLTKKKPQTIDEIVDLQNGYVIPPFGDSHTHSFDSPFNIKPQIQNFLLDGVFYAKVLNNFRSGAIRVKNEVNKKESIDVQYSHGGLTGNYSHPMEVYESLALGFYSYEQQLANAENIWHSRKVENDAYYIITSREELEKKWQMIVDNNPDFIKSFSAK